MQEKDFVSYEYRTVSVKTKDQAKAMDIYEAFGWEATGTSPALGDCVTLSLKRDRHIPHKQELNRLQRQAEDTFAAVSRLERSKTLGASVFSYIFGCIAVLILGGGMSLVMLVEGSIPALVGGIVLGIIGIVLCGVNYPIYKRLASQKTKALLPVIDETEEKLANLLERGNELLSAERI